MRYFTVKAVVGLVVIATALPAYAALDESKMRLTFSDEFDSTSLDLNKWSPHYANSGTINNELQDYVGDALVPDAKKGVLRIRADKRALHVGKQFTSGAITSYNTFNQTYGYFEMRAKLPAGAGLWPAFWLLPKSGAWPPEIDIFEHLGQSPDTIYMSYHAVENGKRTSQTTPIKVKGPANYTNWYHIYGFEWRPDVMIYYIDGKEVLRYNEGIPHQPHYILANMAVGGNWVGSPNASTPFPSTMDIDYIRAYQFTDVPTIGLKGNISIGKVTAVPAVAKAGDNVKITADLEIGANDIGYLGESIMIFDFEAKKRIASKYIELKNVKANTTVKLEMDYTVPATLVDDYYPIAISGSGITNWQSGRFEVRNKARPALAALPPLVDPVNPPMLFPVKPALSTQNGNNLALTGTTINGENFKPGDTVTGKVSFTAKTTDATNVSVTLNMVDDNGAVLQKNVTTIPIVKVGETASQNFSFKIPSNASGYIKIFPNLWSTKGWAYSVVDKVLWVSATGTAPVANVPAGVLHPPGVPFPGGATQPPITTPTPTPDPSTPLPALPALTKPNSVGLTFNATKVSSESTTANGLVVITTDVLLTKDFTSPSAAYVIEVFDKTKGKSVNRTSGSLGLMKAGTKVQKSLSFKVPADAKTGDIFTVKLDVWGGGAWGYQVVAGRFQVR